MNSGEQNECNITKYLNLKIVKELNEFWKEIIYKMFPNAKDDDIIHSFLINARHVKPDIIIKINKTQKLISIKTGHNPSVHQEYINSFYDYLRKYKVSERTIKIISFYHFGLSKKTTNNGSQFTREEIIDKYGEYLIQANEEINKNEKLIDNIIYRSIIKGSQNYYYEIDYFYYGCLDKGFLLSKEEIYDIVKHDIKPNLGPIHFGGLIYQPSGRNLYKRDIKYVRIKWPILCLKFYNNDIIK